MKSIRLKKQKKYVLAFVSAMLISVLSFAQNGINYKAIVKDGSGNVLASSPVTLQFTIYQGVALTNNVYEETHTTNTDANGLVILNIGEGTTADIFEDIAWEVDNHYLNVQVNTGSGLVDLGTTQFKSVPYAKVAEKTKSSESIELPYFDSTTLANGSAFHVHNTSTSAAFGIVGTTGTDGSTIPANRAGVLGYSTNAHGVYGRSENSSYAGVQGVSNSASGYGVLGYGFGGGIGGYFYTTSNGKAALTTGTGNVGIGTQDPEEKMHVAGTLFVQSNLGQLQVGFPGTGNRWAVSTIDDGAHLQFRSRPSGSNSYTTRFRFRQDGEFQVLGSSTFGGSFKGDDSGVHAEATNDTNPDIILGGTTGSTGVGDDGIISSDPSYAGSDIFLRSNDAVVVQLDFDDNETGQFEIKAGDGTEVFEVDESGNVRQNGSLVHSSDRRLKKDITDLAYGLEEILLLQPKAYNWKSRVQKHKSLGLIAQEVQPILKEIVTTSDDEMKTLGISYTELIPILINAIKEQQAIINRQAAQNNELQISMSAMLGRIEKLEAINNQ